ncbi:MAG: uroporphyrinogen decarboxylase family protein [Gemmatimonadota bacterium]
MTGREKLLAALSPAGSPETPAVICYEGIYIRDRWSELCVRPWWYREAPDLDRQLAWRREVIGRLGQDWFHLPGALSLEERRARWIDQRGGRVFRVDRRTGEEEELRAPPVGGWSLAGGLQSAHPDRTPESPTELDALLPPPDRAAWQDPRHDGRADLATALLSAEGRDLLPWMAVASPLWDCYDLWGFEGLMVRVAETPDLIEHAIQRHLDRALETVRTAAALGAEAIWIEECFTDLLGPAAFARLNLPAVQRLVQAIRQAGMASIYYYCGDPAGKWEMLLDSGADALSLEESKKGFRIDIEEVVERVAGRCAVFGNLDAVGVLQDGTDAALRAEVARQLEAGRRTGGRFVMSLGSPVTPGTPVARVRRYCDLVRELSPG